jgi:hypothetical protein
VPSASTSRAISSLANGPLSCPWEPRAQAGRRPIQGLPAGLRAVSGPAATPRHPCSRCPPIHFIGDYAPGTNWVNSTFQAIDCARESVLDFTVTGQHTRAVALLHPCLRHANLRIRRPCLGNVPDPEAALLRRYTSATHKPSIQRRAVRKGHTHLPPTERPTRTCACLSGRPPLVRPSGKFPPSGSM